MNTIIPVEQYRILYGSSYLALVSLAYALYTAQPTVIPIGIGSIFLTSITYWHKPDHSWRRTLDMTVSFTCITYQHCISYRAQYALQYYTLYCMAVAAYYTGTQYYKKGELWKSTYAHLAFHIFCNMANITLYSGYRELPRESQSSLPQ
jgi:hypothetical protein